MPMSALRAPVQERAHKTRAALLEAAEREFAERGYAQTTAKSITARAGVATGSFYQYFTDKDAALRELAQLRFADLAERVRGLHGTPPARLSLHRAGAARRRESLALQAGRSIRAIVAEVLAYHRRDRGLHAVLAERRLADPELAAITDASDRGFVAEVQVRLSRWGYRGDCEAQAFLIFGLIEGSIHSHVLGTRMLTDRRFLDALAESVLTLVRAGIAQKGT